MFNILVAKLSPGHLTICIAIPLCVYLAFYKHSEFLRNDFSIPVHFALVLICVDAYFISSTAQVAVLFLPASLLIEVLYRYWKRKRRLQNE